MHRPFGASAQPAPHRRAPARGCERRGVPAHGGQGRGGTDGAHVPSADSASRSGRAEPLAREAQRIFARRGGSCAQPLRAGSHGRERVLHRRRRQRIGRMRPPSVPARRLRPIGVRRAAGASGGAARFSRHGSACSFGGPRQGIGGLCRRFRLDLGAGTQPTPHRPTPARAWAARQDFAMRWHAATTGEVTRTGAHASSAAAPASRRHRPLRRRRAGCATSARADPRAEGRGGYRRAGTDGSACSIGAGASG